MGYDENERFASEISDSKNKKIISGLVNKFRRKYPSILDEASLQSAVSLALLKAIRHHNPLKKAAFSTFLYQNLVWELKDVVRLLARQNRAFFAQLPQDVPAKPVNDDSLSDFDPILVALSRGESVISIRQEQKLSRGQFKRKLDFLKTKELSNG